MLAPVSGATELPSSANNIAPAAHAASETKAPQAAKQDQVGISKLAQKLASDGDTQAQEIKESNAEKASEKTKGKA